MFKYLLQGILVGLAYVAPIGTQNLYVINTAMRKNKLQAYQVALITIFFDISLAILCFFGVGFLVDKFSILKGVILSFGSIVVTYIGIQLILLSKIVPNEKETVNSTISIISSCLAVTWLNPQAIIDGSLLLGGFRTSLPNDMSKYFIIGVCIASFVWFTSLTTIIIRFRSKFNKLIKWINITCGAILIFYGVKLGYSFVQLILYMK